MNIIKWLSIADRYTKMYLDKQLEPFGINSSQHMYVTKICSEPGISQQEFIEHFYINPSNVTRAISVLENQGYLKRSVDPKDNRGWLLYPTEKAVAACPKIAEASQSWYDFALSGLMEAEREQLAGLLEKTGRALVNQLQEEKKWEN